MTNKKFQILFEWAILMNMPSVLLWILVFLLDSPYDTVKSHPLFLLPSVIFMACITIKAIYFYGKEEKDEE
jgi:hypothetical protein